MITVQRVEEFETSQRAVAAILVVFGLAARNLVVTNQVFILAVVLARHQKFILFDAILAANWREGISCSLAFCSTFLHLFEANYSIAHFQG